jgi:hypothetical protein
VPMGEEGWERARILAGRPAPGAELTEEVNPYEAGLCDAVRVDKVRPHPLVSSMSYNVEPVLPSWSSS